MTKIELLPDVDLAAGPRDDDETQIIQQALLMINKWQKERQRLQGELVAAKAENDQLKAALNEMGNYHAAIRQIISIIEVLPKTTPTVGARK